MAGEYTAAGAAIGSVIPGVGTVVGGAVGALADAFMSDNSGPTAAMGPAGTSSASTAVYGSGLNADNWSVNFRGTQKVTATSDKPFTATGPTSAAGQGAAVIPDSALPGALGGILTRDFFGVPGWAWLGVMGLVAWKFTHKK